MDKMSRRGNTKVKFRAKRIRGEELKIVDGEEEMKEIARDVEEEVMNKGRYEEYRRGLVRGSRGCNIGCRRKYKYEGWGKKEPPNPKIKGKLPVFDPNFSWDNADFTNTIDLEVKAEEFNVKQFDGEEKPAYSTFHLSHSHLLQQLTLNISQINFTNVKIYQLYI